MIDYAKLAAALQLASDAISPDENKPATVAEKKVPAKKNPVAVPETQSPVSNIVPLGGPGSVYGAPPAVPAVPVTEEVTAGATTLWRDLPAVPVTKEELTAAATALWQKTGDQTIIPDLLARHGVTGIKDLDPSQYDMLLKDIQGAAT